LALVDDIAAFYADPLGFVRYAFPWSEPGPLADETGPDDWQCEALTRIGTAVAERWSQEAQREAIRLAVASGHGVGKTALVAWIILWFMSTRINPQVVVTANTKNQLTTKTWRELAKWHRLSINRQWFEWSATSFKHQHYPQTWFASAIPWSEHNSEAFAGTHETDVLVIFDEASAIADSIWEVTEGAMTTPGAMWLAFGNPTRNDGRFAECWGQFRARWQRMQVDSRKAKAANQAQIAQWIADYGEDSDFVRIRVKGEFPRAGANQFIGTDIVATAKARTAELLTYRSSPRVIGVDVARHGDDQSVILKRQGVLCLPPQRYRFDNLMQLAYEVAEEIEKWNPDAVFIDATGIGWGIVDRLRQLGYRNIHAIQVGETAQLESRYYNRRMELWARMRDWLSESGCLPDDKELAADIGAPEYGFDNRGRLQLEKKEDMKARGMASPDSGDALAITFAAPVAARTKEDQPAWQHKLKALKAAKRGTRNPMLS
jgi:hypothetical protein